MIQADWVATDRRSMKTEVCTKTASVSKALGYMGQAQTERSNAPIRKTGDLSKCRIKYRAPVKD